MASRRGPGQPTKYDPVKGERICSALSEGNFLSTAAAIVGVNVRTVERWIERGRLGREPYKTFAESVDRARGQFIFLSTRELVGKGEKPPDPVKSKNIQWLFAHLFPRKYGDRVQVHVQAELEGVLDKLKAAFPATTYDRILSVLAGEPGAAEVGEEPAGPTIN